MLLLFAVVAYISIQQINAVINWNGNNWAMACDFQNGDLSSIQIKGELCSSTCEKTNGCTHFTWTTYNTGTCWMKTGAVTKSDAFSTTDQTMVCGVVGSQTDESTSSGVNTNSVTFNGNWAKGCDFKGQDLADVISKGKLYFFLASC